MISKRVTIKARNHGGALPNRLEYHHFRDIYRTSHIRFRRTPPSTQQRSVARYRRLRTRVRNLAEAREPAREACSRRPISVFGTGGGE